MKTISVTNHAIKQNDGDNQLHSHAHRAMVAAKQPNIGTDHSLYSKAAHMNLATPATVYLLEQDTEITDTIRSLCEEKSFSLRCFQSDNELMQAMDSSQPSCVIAANDQPMGQALDLLASLENREEQVPVIILGHHSDVASAVAAIKAGAIDYIEKPTIYGRLAEHFNQFIKRSASLSAL